jgi:hypothetical protein
MLNPYIGRSIHGIDSYGLKPTQLLSTPGQKNPRCVADGEHDGYVWYESRPDDVQHFLHLAMRNMVQASMKSPCVTTGIMERVMGTASFAAWTDARQSSSYSGSS